MEKKQTIVGRWRGVSGLMTGVVILGGLMVLAGPAWAGEATATKLAPQPLPVDGGVFAVVVDDVDSDGRVDLLVTRRSTETARVLYQKAPRQFESGPAAKVLGFHANGVTRLPGAEHRYVVSAEGRGALKILAPDDQKGLREIASRPQAAAVTTTAFAWPGWGISLAVAPYEGETLTLLRNFRPETAEVEATFDLAVPRHSVPGEATAVDLDGDGTVELLYTTRRSRTLWRVNYPKEGKDPEPVAVWTTPAGAPRQLAAADLTGDGAPDILLPLEPERRIAVLVNDGKGNFTPGPELTVPSSAWGPARLAIAKDRDGSLLLVANTESSLVFYRIVKGNPFRYEAIELPLDANLNQLLLQDIDGDGELDVVVALGLTENALRVLYGPLWKTLVQELKPTGSALAVAAQSGAIKSGDSLTRVVARVGDWDMTVKDVREFVLLSGTGDDMQTLAGQIKVLRLAIEDALMKKAIARELDVPQPLSSDDFSKGLQRLQDRYFPLPPVPEDTMLRAYYEAHQEEFGIPEMVRLVQIQFRNERDAAGGPTARQRAEKALQRLEAGENFETVAAELTESPRAKETGSPDRGFVPRNAEPWLRDAVRGLQPGQRSGIVESPVGYEIHLVKDWRAPVIADFESVRAKVAAQWRKEQQQQAANRYLKTLAEEFGVTILDKELENANPANW